MDVYNVDTDDSVLVATGGGGSVWQGCLPNGVYAVEGFDSFGDSWNGGIFYVDGPAGNLHAIDLVPTGGFGSAEFEININFDAVYGCTDASALNYDGTATDDDGSCYYVGDVCESPFPNAGAAVVDGQAGWYTFDIPAAPGFLSISHDNYAGFADFWVGTSCAIAGDNVSYEGLILIHRGQPQRFISTLIRPTLASHRFHRRISWHYCSYLG